MKNIVIEKTVGSRPDVSNKSKAIVRTLRKKITEAIINMATAQNKALDELRALEKDL